MLTTTLAGSLPKPSWLADPRLQLFAPWVPPADRLREAQDDAVRLCLLDQEETGTDTQRLGKKRTRGGRYVAEQEVARIVGEVTRPGPVMGPALTFAKAHTR